MLLIVDKVPIPMDCGEAEREFVNFTARFLTSVIEQDPEAVHGMLPEALPWMRHLTPAGARRFGTEFAETLRAAALSGDTAAVAQLVVEWRHTAEIYADPELHRALSAGFTGDFGEVPRP